MPKTAQAFYTGVGRRKSSTATIRLQIGRGEYSRNQNETDLPEGLTKILEDLNLNEKFNISTTVVGGGYSSQIDAEKLALARSLVKFDTSLRSTLRKAGLLTVDARVKERKKPGLKRARRAPQWAKR